MRPTNKDQISPTKNQDVPTDWRTIGTVVGNAGIAEFTFILRRFQARVGDIVALGMEIPDGSYGNQDRIYVWARITDIRRFNPFFPTEAAQELAAQSVSLEDTVLAGTLDQLEAAALILGATTEDNLSNIFPLTYPVKPASNVYHPPAEAVRQLLLGDREEEQSIPVGTLIARADVNVSLSAPRLISRHLAILAMTGGGKTVAARRIIRELIKLKYTLVHMETGTGRDQRFYPRTGRQMAPSATRTGVAQSSDHHLIGRTPRSSRGRQP
jgi:hypothetical protein